MKWVCAKTCMYYNAQKFHFGEQYPSVPIVQTLLLDFAHSAASLWKCWLQLVVLTKAMLSRTSVEGEETIEIQMSCIQWSLDVCSLLCGKILNLDEFCHISSCLQQWKSWCTHYCLQDNVLIQAAFLFGCFCTNNCRANYAVGNNTQVTMGQKKKWLLKAY